MKVGLIFAGKFSVPTGVSRYVTELATRLAAEHEVHLILSDGDFNLSGVQIHTHQFHQHPFTQFNPTFPGVKSLWHVAYLTIGVLLNAVRNTRMATSVRKAHTLDIIHAQSTDALSADVVTFHACLKAALQRNRPVSRHMRIQHQLGAILFAPYTYTSLALESHIIRHTRRIITVSESLKDDLVRSYGISRDRITVIPLGVDMERFKPDPDKRNEIRKALGIRREETVAIFVGHYFESKGLEAILDAIEPLSSVRLIVIGNDLNLPRFRKRVEASGFGNRVIFTGSLGQGIEHYYAAADMFVLPSESEGFCVAAIEAAACALPLIVTPVGELPAFVEDGVTGYLVGRNPTEIRERIAHLATQPTIRLEMGMKARERARHYSWQNVKEATLEVYRTLMTDSNY